MCALLNGEWKNLKPFVKEAYFLPVKQRINFKIVLMTFKRINMLQLI